MRARLVKAAKEALMEVGYGRTTAVEVCSRASVTRGALFHHFSGLSSLLAAALEEICESIGNRLHEAQRRAGVRLPMSERIEGLWTGFGDPEFKVVIEAWLAARNDPELRKDIQPVIDHFQERASPSGNAELAEQIGSGAEHVIFYRLVLEAMIGMALGRAVSKDGKPLGHEEVVIDLLKEIAKARGM